VGSLVVQFWYMSLVASETPRGPAAPPLSAHLRSRYPPHPKVTLSDLPGKSTEWLGGSKGRKRSMCTLNRQSLCWIATSLPIVGTPSTIKTLQPGIQLMDLSLQTKKTRRYAGETVPSGWLFPLAGTNRNALRSARNNGVGWNRSLMPANTKPIALELCDYSRLFGWVGTADAWNHGQQVLAITSPLPFHIWVRRPYQAGFTNNVVSSNCFVHITHNQLNDSAGKVLQAKWVFVGPTSFHIHSGKTFMPSFTYWFIAGSSSSDSP